jgi:hypothetical protein
MAPYPVQVVLCFSVGIAGIAIGGRYADRSAVRPNNEMLGVVTIVFAILALIIAAYIWYDFTVPDVSSFSDDAREV